MIGAGLFDMVDGRVARETNRVTRFGGFFDSVLDRYSDLALYIGLLVYYASINRFFYIVLTAIVMTGSSSLLRFWTIGGSTLSGKFFSTPFRRSRTS